MNTNVPGGGSKGLSIWKIWKAFAVKVGYTMVYLWSFQVEFHDHCCHCPSAWVHWRRRGHSRLLPSSIRRRNVDAMRAVTKNSSCFDGFHSPNFFSWNSKNIVSIAAMDCSLREDNLSDSSEQLGGWFGSWYKPFLSWPAPKQSLLLRGCNLWITECGAPER